MDAGYKTPAIAKLLIDNGQTPVFPYKRPMTKKGFFKKNEYAYDEYYDCYICPVDQIINYSTTNREGYREYKSNGHADGYILQVKLGGKWYNKYKFPADVYGAKIEGTCHNETHIYRIQAFRGSVKKSSFWVSARTSLSHRKNVSTVTISKTSLTMTAGQSEKLSASLTPSSNIVSTYKRWKSSNRKVAAVSSNGTVTAKAAGTAKIWCIAHNGKKSEKCKVTVTEPAP